MHDERTCTTDDEQGGNGKFRSCFEAEARRRTFIRTSRESIELKPMHEEQAGAERKRIVLWEEQAAAQIS